MGIRGLFKYLKDNMAFDIVDMVNDAERNKEIEILVDFNAYIRDFYELFIKRINKEYNNEFLLFPAGEFDILFDALYKFQKIFESIGIKLVWIVDGPKGLDKVSSQQKQQTWKQRDEKDDILFNETLSCCDVKEPPPNLGNLMPLFTFQVSLASLKKAGAEVIQLLHGESDEFIAYEFHRRKSYAIITNDTDFLVFRDCKVIFPRLMNIPYGDEDCNLPFLDYENPGSLFKAPESFKCPIVKQQHILNLLKLGNPDQLVVLSILKGNDNISEYYVELQNNLEITKGPSKYPHITRVAQYIRDHKITMKNILEFEPIKRFTNQHPELITAINFCKEFYSLKRIEKIIQDIGVTYKKGAFDNPLTDFLAEKYSKLELSTEIYYRHIMSTKVSFSPEESDPTLDSSSLADIKSKVYPYFLDENDSLTASVEHAIIKTNEIHSNTNITNSSVNGVDLFEEIWSHLEPSGLHYVKKFGLDCGFICYILRYFYKITDELDINEFRALFVSVFYNYSLWKGVDFTTKLKKESFLTLRICPTAKCLSRNTWFVSIFGTAKYFFGGALNLTEEFPSIKNIFSGSVFFAFYETIMNEFNERTSHLNMDLQKCIVDLDQQIMEKNKEIYLVITDLKT